MGLLTGKAHALGRRRKSFFTAESTAGTFNAPSDSNAVKMLSHGISLDRSRVVRADSRQTRSALERIQAKGAIAWDAEGYLIPSGTAGTAPDIDDLIEAAMGLGTNTPATSEVYTLTAAQALKTLTITRHMPDVLMEDIIGAWVETMTISASGGDQPKIKFDGGAMGHILTGVGETDGADTGTEVTYEVEDAGVFSVNSRVNVGSDTDILVTAVTVATPSFTVGSFTWLDAEAIIPYSPTEVTAGSPISGLLGSLVLDPVAPFAGTQTVPITSFEVTLKNNIKALEDEAFEEFASDVIPGYREVTGSVSFRARADLLHIIGLRERAVLSDFAVTLGTTAGSICTIDLDQVEFDWAGIDVPEAEEAIITVPFTSLGSSGEDELTVSFT